MPTSAASPAPAAPPSAPSAPSTRLSLRERLAVLVLFTASFTLAVDFSILTVALPRIGRDVGLGVDDLQWVTSGFAVCAAGFTLLFGRLADLVGRRRIFLLGAALLGVASLVGGLATDPAVLLSSRVAQGVATAMVTPAALSLLTTAFPEGPARDRVLGLNSALMAAGFTCGALLGGVLTEAVSWRWAFFLNVAVAAFVLVAGPLSLREAAGTSPGRATGAPRERLDVPGALTVTTALVALVFAISRAGTHSWFDPAVAGALAVAVVSAAVFVSVERRAAHPLVRLEVLRQRQVSWGNLTLVTVFATETALVFVLTLHLQEVLGFSPLVTGLVFGALGVASVTGGVLAPRVIAKAGVTRTICLGFLVQGAAVGALALGGDQRAWVLPLTVLGVVTGVAHLLAIVAGVVSATSGVPDELQGMATGLVTMSQQVGMTLGTPVLAAVITAFSAGGAAGGLLPGVRAALVVDAALCLVAAAAVGFALRTRSPRAQ
ncbi:Major Facilitator Superfamily protein [Quadrisphaera granulorum]|uniref:MFS transporter n=1 Tax=Quadrisphaera granulorum TaxID=317664 RepID=A0A316AED1_9ACTN|nr:MFS transporter [Quadrisphaera granulorum]PWJ56135.1 MFS transporter [Quadrisphaera granulorum]SZE94769.1 Major Facilitator Superfamily protein [Quadrisphaera granulorum]